MGMENDICFNHKYIITGIDRACKMIANRCNSLLLTNFENVV